jgi:hypothetical protein
VPARRLIWARTVALQPAAQFRQRLYAPSLKLDALALKRRRAAKLAEEAQRVRDADDRRHLLELAETYRRAADQGATVSS